MYYALVLVGISVIAFILQLVIPGFTETFLLDSSLVLFQPWRLITSIFLHGGFAHLLFNMFGLAMFGMILENIIGKKKFLIVFFVGGFFASLGSTVLYSRALGASGALFAVLGMLAVLRPHMQVWVSYFPMPMYMAAGAWTVLNLFGLFVPDGIANLAHLVGLVVGLGAGFYFKKTYEENNINEHSYTIDEDTLNDWEDEHMK